jgi:hypothetical protein
MNNIKKKIIVNTKEKVGRFNSSKATPREVREFKKKDHHEHKKGWFQFIKK